MDNKKWDELNKVAIFNEVRNQCMCRGGDNEDDCGIPKPTYSYGGTSPMMEQRCCYSGNYKNCPLFMFAENMWKAIGRNLNG